MKKSKSTLSLWENLILGTVLGWVVFTLLGYILLVLNLKFLMFVILAIGIFVFLRKQEFYKWKLNKRILQINLPKKFIYIFIPIFIVGVIMQLLIMVPSGLKINGDILFWSSHAHDASWHIALMSQMEKGWPIQNPAFAGERLVNYHFFSDITPMYFNYLFKLPFLDLYFRFLPFFYAFIFGTLAYLLGKRITGSFWGGFWSFIFADFAGSFGFIITYLRDKTIGGESLFWSSQPQSTIGNPPQISAFILILTFFYLFDIYLKKKDKLLFLSLVLIGGILIAFKVYGGIALLGGLGVCAFWQIIKEKRWDLFLMFILSAALSSFVFFPNTAKTTSLLVFEPWWYIRTLVVAPDRLNWLDLELRRQTYIAEHNLKRVIQLETTAFLIFFFGNLGMRFLGLAVLPAYLKKFFTNYFDQLLLSITLFSFIFPMLFIQRGDTAGTSQFFQYYLLILGVFASQVIIIFSRKIKSLFLKIILGALIILLALPTQIGLLTNFYHRTAFTKIDQNEQAALSFLRNNTPSNSIILTPLFNKYLRLNGNVPPLWGWSDTDYVGAFGQRAVYLADEEQVANTGYNYQPRKDLEENLFFTTDPYAFEILIKIAGANYLYFPIAQKPNVDLTRTSLERVFSNDLIEIWKI